MIMSKCLLPTRSIQLATLSLLSLLLATGCNPPDANPSKPTPSTTSTSPSEPFDERLKNAESLLGQKKLEEAWAISKGLLVEQPKSVPALFLASQIMAARKNLPGAIELISQIDPSDPKAGPAATGQLSEWNTPKQFRLCGSWSIFCTHKAVAGMQEKSSSVSFASETSKLQIS